MNSRTLLMLAALMWASTPAVASVRGTVRDSTGAAVHGATIDAPLVSSSCSTQTAGDGSFELPCADPGAVVRVEASGFDAISVTATAHSLDVVLSPRSYAEAVVVTASRSEGVRTSGRGQRPARRSAMSSGR